MNWSFHMLPTGRAFILVWLALEMVLLVLAINMTKSVLARFQKRLNTSEAWILQNGADQILAGIGVSYRR